MTHAATRRDFLRQAAALAAAAHTGLLASPLRAAPPAAKTPPALVAVFLRGGADWLNMVVPWKDSDYHTVRPTIRLGEDEGVLPLDSRFALHPALAPLAPLYQSKVLAPVINAGSPHGTRSHFDAQDFMERGAPGLRNITSGWLSRYLAATAKPGGSEFRALAMKEVLPRSLRGDHPALAVPTSMDKKKGQLTLGRFEEFYGDGMPGAESEQGAMKGRDEEAAKGEEVVQSGRMTIDTLRRYHEITAAAGSGRGAYPASRFGDAMRIIATVLKADAGLEVAAVDYPGWDHHINQGGIEGRQQQMLADYAQTMAAFAADLGERLETTLAVTMTEFGRTVAENGNNGTDHGRGGGMFLLGGGVKGGKVHGDWRGLQPDALADGRDLPVTTDFRDVLAAGLDGVFGFRAPKDFFPDYKPGRTKLF
ncbi:MAG: DUF1501 domain-containing protein [Planctomycetes bacterium]|nr:DUF1501 domain-containing protein [Planctomycetota bacterium]MBL7008734.1 DUF1501 domain-containing protein [Planctomycetota bacterium]